MKWKFYSLAFVAGMSILTACSSDDNNDNDGNGGNGNGNEIENGTILKGTITSDVTLAAGNTYKLSGEYIVEEGGTLHIEEGVKIIAVYDDIADYILVKQGGKINAVGTPDKPIVMTSEKEEPGAWGGIHICGRAHTNAEGGKGSSEIGGAVTAATMMPTTRARCNTFVWNTPALPSMKSTKPTVSLSTA